MREATPITYTESLRQNYDPTHTTLLRNMFAKDMSGRFREIVRAILIGVAKRDCFGLKKKVHTLQVTTPAEGAFAFERSQAKVSAFMKWLEQQVEKGILTVRDLEQVGTSVDAVWLNKYLYDSYKRGVIRARYEMSKVGIEVPSVDDSGGIGIVMGLPMHIDRIGLIFTRVFAALKGVTDDMDRIISQILAQGIADGDGPALLARKMVAAIDGTNLGKLGITDKLGRFIPAQRRAEILARTEIIRAHHLATIQEYRNWGALKIYLKAEWKTAGDGRVCFLANTKVTTKRGYIYIQDVKVGDYVLTHKDRYRKVTKLYHRKYDGNVVRITLKGCKETAINLTATENHLLLVNNRWIKIKDIKVGDKINYIAKRCPECNKLMPVFNTYCSLSCASKVGNRKLWSDPKQKERVKEDNKRYKEINGVSKISMAKASHVKKLEDPEFYKNFCNQVSKGQLKSYRDNPIHLKNVTLSNQEKGKREDWGWKNKERREKCLKKAHTKIAQNHNGKTYIEKKIEWWLKKGNFKYESQKYFNNGNKKFWVDFYLPEFNVIIEADGKYWHNEIKDRIRDEEIKKVFTGKILHFKEDDIRDNFKLCTSQLEELLVSQNCFVEVEVRKISKWKLRKVQPVYNLEVEEDNTYTANRIIVHNCEECAKREGKVYTLDEAEGLIPFHPSCRCIMLPWSEELLKYEK